MKGRTAILTAYFQPLELREYDVPDPDPGAIIVRISQAGLCGSDLHTWRGDQQSRLLPKSGRPMGHEGTGTVYSLGKGVTRDFQGNSLREGDRIVFSAVYSCGRCQACLDGDNNLCPDYSLNYRTEADQYPFFVNTYSDFMYLPPNHPVFKVPDELTDEEVASLNCALGVVFQGLKVADMEQGKTVVIQGCGGLGLYAIALAQDMGAAHIIAIDGQKARLDLAQELGADQILDINELDAKDARIATVMQGTAGRGADIVIELVGLSELVQEGVDMLVRGGTFLEIGNLMRDRSAVIYPQSLVRRKKIIGSSMYRPGYIPKMLDFLLRNHNKIPLHRIISHKFPLERINDAFAESEWEGRDTNVIRSVIVP